jgi:hypothetical protein
MAVKYENNHHQTDEDVEKQSRQLYFAHIFYLRLQM